MAIYHEERTVQWGNWGITFMDANPDRSENFGRIVGQVSFPIGTRGPFVRDKRIYEAMCEAWIIAHEIPAGMWV